MIRKRIHRLIIYQFPASSVVGRPECSWDLGDGTLAATEFLSRELRRGFTGNSCFVSPESLLPPVVDVFREMSNAELRIGARTADEPGSGTRWNRNGYRFVSSRVTVMRRNE